MKRLRVSGVIVLAFGVLAPQFAPAQGTTYLSSLSYASSGSYSVGNDSWLGIDFTTGDNANGYTLDSVQLALTDALEQSSDGLNWSFANTSYVPQFALNATPAPEPGVLSLFAAGSLIVALCRRKRFGAA